MSEIAIAICVVVGAALYLVMGAIIAGIITATKPQERDTRTLWVFAIFWVPLCIVWLAADGLEMCAKFGSWLNRTPTGSDAP